VARGPEEQGQHQLTVHGGPGVQHEQASFFLEGMDGCMVVFAVGEIDLATSPTLQEALVEAVESRRNLVVDLSAVSFLDSTGLGVLIRTRKRIAATHKSMSLVGPTGMVGKVLRITGIDQAIPVHPNLDTALGATSAE
jgi:anti-sigma B factor antagonist